MFSKLKKMFKKEDEPGDFEGIATKAVETEESEKSLFPVRKSKSLMDNFGEQAREGFEHGDVGTVVITDSWETTLKGQPPDVPFFAGFNGVPCIYVRISQSSLPDPDDLTKALDNELGPAGLYVKAFLSGDYPIVRCILCVRDNPRSPLYFEGALNVENGDVQDFYQAVMAGEKMDLILATEGGHGKTFCISCGYDQDLKAMMKNEFGEVLEKYKKSGGRGSYSEAVEILQDVYQSAADGVLLLVNVSYIGPAENKTLNYEEDPRGIASGKEDNEAGHPDLSSDTETEDREAMRQEVKASLEKNIRDHMQRVFDNFRGAQGYDITKPLWEKILLKENMVFIVDAIDEHMKEAISEGKHCAKWHHMQDLFISVSVIPEGNAAAGKKYFDGGYLNYLNSIASSAGFPETNLAHLIFCSDLNTQTVHLTFLNSKNTPGGIAVFAQDFMTPEEKAELGMGG